MRDREGLIARIRQVRRAGGTTGAAGPPGTVGPTGTRGVSSPVPAEDANPDAARVHALEVRTAHLEALVEGLQDSVYREAERQSKLISELEARMQPAALGVALSQNARERGL